MNDSQDDNILTNPKLVNSDMKQTNDINDAFDQILDCYEKINEETENKKEIKKVVKKEPKKEIVKKPNKNTNKKKKISP